jgi:hypothetical protein
VRVLGTSSKRAKSNPSAPIFDGFLAKLGLDTIKLEPQANGHYAYCAWNRSLVEQNGSAKTVKRGKIRILPG